MTSKEFSRRGFVSNSAGAAALVAAAAGSPASAAAVSPRLAGEREVYELRTYHLRIGTQAKLVGDFLAEGLLPTLNRLGVEKVGVFSTLFGPEIPSLTVLVPHKSFAAYAKVQDGLWPALSALKTPATRAYLDAGAASPAYVRIETQVLRAFPTIPRMFPVAKADRVFELRVYESATEIGHEKKMAMFSPKMGELEIFKRAGLTPVFHGQGIAGPRLPSFTYLLTFPDLQARKDAWDRFRADPAWLALRATEGYADADILSNITSLMLAPTAYSQI